MTSQWWIPRSVPWETAFPLPLDTARLLLQQESLSDNAGLTMDRLLAYGDTRQGPELVRELVDRSGLTPDYAAQGELFAAWLSRWEATARALGASTFRATPEWRVIVGLGTHRILESGITLHHVYGLPIVPATALKGITRWYAERVAEAPVERIVQLFGQADIETRRGDLVFLDAIPVEPPHMERDIANPHFGGYYGSQANVPPADYMAPKPIFFLTVGHGSRFVFGLASLSQDDEAAAQGLAWLQRALLDLGVGAKSAAGYGYWRLEG